MRFGHGHGVGLMQRRRAGGSPVAGALATTFALAPAIHYHPHSQVATLDGGNRVTACPDMSGLAALTGVAAGGSTIGPVQMTDGLGRKFWRFRGADALIVANTLNALNARGVTVMMAARVHHAKSGVNFFVPRYSAYTDDTTNTAFSGSATMRTAIASNSAAWLYGTTGGAFGDATNGYKCIPGAQLQVIGCASRTTANGGQRLYINNDVASVAQSSTTSASCTGGIIGGLPAASNAVTLGSSNQANTGNFFDLYEFALWKGELTNAQADAAAAAMVGNYAIAVLTRQLVLEGDSITNAVTTSLPTDPTSAGCMAMLLTEPGAMQVPSDCRVLNIGSSGATTATLVARRDAANSLFGALYPGGAANNIVAVQIGRNDMSESSGKKNSAMFYADMVGLINTASTGYLQRGWKAVAVAGIATSAAAVTTNVLTGETTIQARVEAVRALLADATNHQPNAAFLNDCLAGSAQTYAGLVDVLHLYDVSVGGSTRFRSATNANDSASGYYDSDATHLRLAGQMLMAGGGDTAPFGYASIV